MGFLTDRRREVLNNYDQSNSNHRSVKSRTRGRASEALDDLIFVAANPVIDNADLFDPERVRTLLSVLLGGRGGIVPAPGDEVASGERAWAPTPEYRASVYTAIARAQLNFELQASEGELYEALGEKARAVRNLNTDEDTDE